MPNGREVWVYYDPVTQVIEVDLKCKVTVDYVKVKLAERRETLPHFFKNNVYDIKVKLTGISSHFMLSQSWFIPADLAPLRLFRICNKLWVSPSALYYTRVWVKHQHGISKKQSPGGPLALGHLICLHLTSTVALSSAVLAAGLWGCYSEALLLGS